MAQAAYYSNKCNALPVFGQSHQDDISSPDGMDTLCSKIEQDWQSTQYDDVRSQVCANLDLKYIDPELWDIDDVQVWLRWVSTTCLKMEQSDVQRVCMDGRSLCSCTEESFREMLQVLPTVGAKIYQIFQAWRQNDIDTIKSCDGGGLWNNMPYQEPVILQKMQYQQMDIYQPVYQPEFDHNNNNIQIDSEPWLHPVGLNRPPVQAPYDRAEEFGRPPPMHQYYPMAATYPSSMGGCQTVPCDTDMLPHDLDKQPRKRRGPGRPKLIRPPKTKKLQLFEFLLDYLENPHSPHLEWIDKSSGLFRFQSVHKEDFANKWGDYKGNRNMTYQNLARALRNYCHGNHKIMLNEKRKLHYRFNIDAIMEHPTKFKIVFRSYAKHTRKS